MFAKLIIFAIFLNVINADSYSAYQRPRSSYSSDFVFPSQLGSEDKTDDDNRQPSTSAPIAPQTEISPTPADLTSEDPPTRPLLTAGDPCDTRDLDVKGVCREDCPVAKTGYVYHYITETRCYSDEFLWCCTNLTSGTLPQRFNLSETWPPWSLNTLVSQKECLVTYNAHGVEGVVRGVVALPEEFPHMAVLGFPRKGGGSYEIKCGGVLIAPNFVLTAAHCTRVRGKSPEVVKIGGTNLNNASAPFLPIVEIINHPQYRRKKTYHDIALLRLGQNASELPACLWITEATYHSGVQVIGYGHTEYEGKGTADLLKANLSIYTNDFCKEYYTPEPRSELGVIDSQLCIGDPELLRDTCQGDSGGPVILKKVFNNIQIPYVLGITSYGKGCAQGFPGIYTRVASYVDWIESIVWPSG